MRAVRASGDRVEVVDVAEPSGDGVRVRIRSAGICGSDLHLLGSPWLAGVTLGHEFAGVLDDGRAVAVEPVRGCGQCAQCRGGDYNLCAQAPGSVMGVGADGGMADQVLVSPSQIVPLPAGVDPADACLVEPLAVAAHGFRLSGFTPGQRVAVIGGGTIGLCAAGIARAAGAEVAVAARHDAQRAAADRLGAVALTEEPYDIVVESAGTSSAMADAISRCRPGGAVLVLGSYWEGLEIPAMELCMKEVRIVPSSMYGRGGTLRDIDAAAQVLAASPELVPAIITHRYPLEAAPEAFATAADRSAGAIKVVLEP
ncbi:MAG: alcohol dehydrogenase catalytic domain-containing protein [Acidimicrobiales bacterium]|nr:alcohol dehydrogenase catalytic domain-containing protein [Acidimicrobiales bacterium]